MMNDLILNLGNIILLFLNQSSEFLMDNKELKNNSMKY